MNVRFFAGTKADYLSLPTPRNPLGLYFCADTKELFWADRLLTDGTRIVPTFADLPSFDKAAEGITYYVEETRNGYVLSADRTKWVQVIYAPDNGSAIKAISFAGIEMEEADGVFTIDRRCAREALGFKVPEGMENEEIVIATEDFVKNEIEKINNPEVSLDGYATEQYVTDAIAAINPVVEEVKTKLETEVLPIVPTVQETILPTVQKVETEILPAVQELAEKAATQEWVQEQNFATENFVAEKIAEIDIPETLTKVSELENDAGYLTEHQSLEEYAKKADIPEAEIYKVDFNAPDFTAAFEAYNNRKLLLLTNAAPDANSYAVMNYVREDKITFTKFLMSRSEAYGAFNTYYLSPDNTWEISKEVKLNKVEANVIGEVNSELANIRIGKEVYSLPSIDGLASTEYVDNAIANIPETDLSNYYNKEETETLVNEAVNGIEIPDTSNFITMQDVEDKGYLTEHQDISGKSDIGHIHTLSEITDYEAPDLSEYAKKAELPSIEGLASENFVTEQIEAIQFPETDLSSYSTTAEMTEAIAAAVETKVDKVLFTTAKYVTNPIGNFKAGDDIQGIKIAEIFAKLLGLVDELPEEPEIPSEPQGIIETIMANEISMYHIDENDKMILTGYKLLTYTEADVATTNDGQSGFYKVTNAAGEILEAGYQHYSTSKDPYYIVALPDVLEVAATGNTQLQTWDPAEGKWVEAEYVLTSDYTRIVEAYNADGIEPPVAIADYKLWADLSMSDPGTIYRFVIKE